MFDGCELDFDTSTGDRRFFGGVYPFEFVPDDTPVTTLPTAVDEHGDLTGAWEGPLDTPFGAIPLELDVQPGKVAVAMMDRRRRCRAEARDRWVRASFEFDLLPALDPSCCSYGWAEVASRLERCYALYEGEDCHCPPYWRRGAGNDITRIIGAQESRPNASWRP